MWKKIHNKRNAAGRIKENVIVAVIQQLNEFKIQASTGFIPITFSIPVHICSTKELQGQLEANG